ncbi:head-tail connector protein [Peptacetobacter sp.]|uniref:head-tail connector protein n=1 Tax=Peptacetobacter sp. TaxID=2991975 RepID=UPI003AB339CA
MPTKAEVLAYLGIDYADETIENNIDRLIKTADKYLEGSIGKDYPKDDERAKELALIVISDLYDNRGINEKNGVSNNVRRLVNDFSLQLRLELSRGYGGI